MKLCVHEMMEGAAVRIFRDRFSDLWIDNKVEQETKELPIVCCCLLVGLFLFCHIGHNILNVLLKIQSLVSLFRVSIM